MYEPPDHATLEWLALVAPTEVLQDLGHLLRATEVPDPCPLGKLAFSLARALSRVATMQEVPTIIACGPDREAPDHISFQLVEPPGIADVLVMPRTALLELRELGARARAAGLRWALDGWSTDSLLEAVGWTARRPPEVLFCRIPTERARGALVQGLEPQGSRLVVLSSSREEAVQRGPAPSSLLLSVRAGAMAASGHSFFWVADAWRTRHVPAEYLEWAEPGPAGPHR